MKTKKINTFFVIMWFWFIYLGLSLYLANFSESNHKHYSLLNDVLADIQYSDSQNPLLWYNWDNSNIAFSVTEPWSATVVAWSPVRIAPPPSRCTH